LSPFGNERFATMSDKQVQKLDEIKELVELMIAKDLIEVEIVDGDNKIHLKRPQVQHAVFQGMVPGAMPVHPEIPAMASPATTPAAGTAEEAGLIDVKSPIVGTFYSAPSPDSEPYVQVGADVSPDSVVCIIEAMKVMNEIKAECAGTVVKVLATNGKAVEYGQVLFKVRPHG